MTNRAGVRNQFDQERQAFLGVQEYLSVDSLPAASTGLVGSNFFGYTAAPDGTYICFIDLSGLANKLTILLRATFGVGSVTTSGGSVQMDETTIITAFSGIGAMTSTVVQTITLTPITGERYAKLTIVVAGGASPTITLAECYGN
jgi:hypothetical protein